LPFFKWLLTQYADFIGYFNKCKFVLKLSCGIIITFINEYDMPTSKPTFFTPNSMTSGNEAPLPSSNLDEKKDLRVSITTESSSGDEIDSPPRRIVEGEEFQAEMASMTKSFEECAVVPIATVFKQLNEIKDETLLTETSDEIMKELQGIRDHYGIGPEAAIAKEVMYQVKEYASDFIKALYEENAIPGTSPDYATVLPTYFSNFVEAFLYRPQENEPKAPTNPSLRR
jgi:hypothetical protein